MTLKQKLNEMLIAQGLSDQFAATDATLGQRNQNDKAVVISLNSDEEFSVTRENSGLLARIFGNAQLKMTGISGEIVCNGNQKDFSSKMGAALLSRSRS